MESKDLTVMISQIVDEILARQAQRSKVIRVILTGHEQESLLDTLNCIKALYRSGYGIAVTLSHSAQNSVIKSVFLRWQQEGDIEFSIDSYLPNELRGDYYGVFFPAISTNSLSKLALCIRDNLATSWAFHALLNRKPITATFNHEYQTVLEHGPVPFIEQISTYINKIEGYGVRFITERKASHIAPKSLITLADVKLQPENQSLFIEKNTIITPSAKEEIARRRISIERIN
ncbi:flavoprotein [Vibrio sp. FNV 38]|nr:flavoprotein [Vibrio sp. FNV 38]